MRLRMRRGDGASCGRSELGSRLAIVGDRRQFSYEAALSMDADARTHESGEIFCTHHP